MTTPGLRPTRAALVSSPSRVGSEGSALVPCAQSLETRGSSPRLRKSSKRRDLCSADALLGSHSLGLCSSTRADLEPDLGISGRAPVFAARLLVTLLLATLFWAPPLLAHQQKEAITRVLFNQRTGNIEVMHRFLLHDAEHAIRKLFGADADLLGNAEDRDRFEAYVHGRFALVDQDGTAIPLAPVGNELDGRHLWVYAEAPIPAELTALTLSHDALRDVWPDQVNLVNVERDGTVRSATFDGGRREATIHF